MKKKIFATVLFCIFFVCIISVSADAADIASGTIGSSITWVIDGNGTLTIDGEGDLPSFKSSSAPWLAFKSDITSAVICDGITSVSDCTFYKCSLIEDVSIPDSVTSIGDYAFQECISLDEISIPDSVTSLGYQAFYACDGLTSVTLPGSIKEMGQRVFEACENLVSVTLDDGITEIPMYMFTNCTSLETLTFTSSVKSIGLFALRTCSALTDVYFKGTESDWSAISIASLNDGLTNAEIHYISASGECGDNLTWILDDEGTLTISGDGEISASSVTWDTYRNSVKNIVIKDGVTSVGDYVFYGYSNLESATIGNDVASIGKSTFSFCYSLESVTIPDSVASIGKWAFSSCSKLASVTVGNGVTSIGDYAFNDSDRLISITVDENNRYFSNDEYGVLFNKDKTTLIKYPGGNDATSYAIPDSVTHIGNGAFDDCDSLESITIPDSVTSIGNGAFSSCSKLASITIPVSVISIEDDAFNYCTSLEMVIYNGSEEMWNKIAIGSSNFSLTNATLIYSVASGTCGENLTWVLDNDGILTICGNGDMTDWSHYSYVPWYEKKSEIKSVVIQNGVTSIGDCAFCYCDRLTSVVIPGNVTNIGYAAFCYCDSLTSVTIPDSVTSIGGLAFVSCDSLANVTIGNDVTSIGNNAFESCHSLESITIPDSVTSIGDSAFSNCSSLESVTLGIKVTSIGSYAFSRCDSLTSIVIPDSATSIGSCAFASCDSLANVTIGSGVTSIGDYAFSDCTSLESVTIGSSVTSIGDYAFSDCTSLESVTIGSGVTSIGNYAFSDCTSLESVTIGSGVTSIVYRAFYGCDSLKTVHYNGTQEMWKKISIGSGNSSLTSAERVYFVNVNLIYENGEEISIVHTPGNIIDASYIPEKQNYIPVFYKDESRTERISADTPISENITLCLGYEPVLYTYSFVDDDGNVLKTESVPYGTIISPPEVPTKESTDEFSYTFVGWKDFTDGMTQANKELVFVAQYNSTRNDLEKFRLLCDDTVDIGASFDLTAKFATNITAQYICMTVGIPEGFTLKELNPVDFAEISLDSEEHKNGYTYFTYLGIYDYEGTDIPKNERVVPFEMVIDCSTEVVKGDYLITLSDVALIDNNGEFIPLVCEGATVKVKAKLAEGITIEGPSKIDKPTSFTASVYPDYTSDKRVLWSVDNEAVATIDENGLLTPVNCGSVIITATAADGSGVFATKTVDVIKYASIMSLVSDIGLWDMAFDPEKFEYTINVDANISTITITPIFTGGVLRPNGSGLWISGTKKTFTLDEDTTTITLHRQNASGFADSVYTLNVVRDSLEGELTFYGAQIRRQGEQGLRFIFEISKEAYALLSESQRPDDEGDTGVGFGTVLLPRKLLGEATLTKETENAAIIPAVKIYHELEDSILFTVCLTKTLPKNYQQEYVAVPYITYLDNTGEEITIYGEETTNVTVYNIADLAYRDPEASLSLKRYLYNNILSLVNPDYEG